MVNIAVIAGYDVLADTIPTHQQYVKASYEFAQKHEVNRFLVVGGPTNPNYPEKTEAIANFRILKNLGCPREQINILPTGDTSQDTLEAAKKFIGKDRVQKLILCAEQARLASFLLDALNVGLLDLATAGIYAYGHRFPESGEAFEPQRKKAVLKALSTYRFFRFVRWLIQKRHQKQVAKQKQQEQK